MTEFTKEVYETVRKIPRGKVLTYGQIAFMAGRPKAGRIVGQILHRNPDPVHIPCHRVVFADGHLAHRFAFGGEQSQRELLKADGVSFTADGKVKMSKHNTFIYEH